jgi:DNA-directed RNA polymerase specialized sigma24 family protein
MELTTEVLGYRDRLTKIAVCILSDDRAEDAVQHAYIAFHAANGVRDAYAWLSCAVRRAAFSEIRHTDTIRRHERAIARTRPEAIHDASPDDRLERLPDALGRLHPDDRGVIYARLSGIRDPTVALTTSRKRFQRAKERLRAILVANSHSLAL